MSLSRGQPVPAAFSETWTRPEQSMPRLALAAPEIGRADEAFGDRDEILFHRVEAADMPSRQIPALARYGERAVFAGDRHALAPIDSVSTGGSLIDGPGNANVRNAVTLCVGAAAGLASAASGIQPT